MLHPESSYRLFMSAGAGKGEIKLGPKISVNQAHVGVISMDAILQLFLILPFEEAAFGVWSLPPAHSTFKYHIIIRTVDPSSGYCLPPTLNKGLLSRSHRNNDRYTSNKNPFIPQLNSHFAV